ncbi:MAG: 50S ribosomal protein L21e [Thermoplasmatota archaeon]
MVIRSKGIRSKSRKLLTKKPRQRGIHSITKALQQFDIGASVSIVIDPGSSYLVGIFDGKKHKTLIARPEHLRRVQ